MVYFLSRLAFAVGGLRRRPICTTGCGVAPAGAPSFFKTTPSGRILSRAQDVDLADNQLREAMSTMMQCFFEVTGTFALIFHHGRLDGRAAAARLLPLEDPPVLPADVARLKRLDSVTSAPIFSHLNEALSGLSSIQLRLRRELRRAVGVAHQPTTARTSTPTRPTAG